MHDIGKNLVKIMMEGSGLEVVDLGVDVTAEQFVDTAIAQHCDIIACSSLLTTTMPEMRAVVELTKTRGIRDQVKIFVGGAHSGRDAARCIRGNAAPGGADLRTAGHFSCPGRANSSKWIEKKRKHRYVSDS